LVEGLTATATGALPTETVAVTVLFEPSITDTELEFALAT
jgi:hypothetical protein